MRLSEYEFAEVEDRSTVGQLPEHVRADLIEARQSGSHNVPQMVEWLHNDPEHGDTYRHVTADLLHAWFRRKGFMGPNGQASGGGSK